MTDNSKNQFKSYFYGILKAMDFRKPRWLKKTEQEFLDSVKTVYDFGKNVFVITENSDCYGLGENDCGILGIGSPYPAKVFTPCIIPVLCQKNMTNWSCGENHVVASTDEGELFAWGGNYFGQLGLGHADDTHIPTVVAGPLSTKKVIATACGDAHTLVLTSQGEIFGTGRNGSGQIGIRTTTSTYCFVRIFAVIENSEIIQISCGLDHSAAVSKTGEIFLWGKGNDGRIGIGNVKNQMVPCKLNFQGQVEKVTCGDYHTLALTKTGHVYGWGSNYVGQLGVPRIKHALKPIQIWQTLEKAVDILAMEDFSCCKSVRKVYTWGRIKDTKRVSPKGTSFTNMMQAASDATFNSNYQPIILSKLKDPTDILLKKTAHNNISEQNYREIISSADLKSPGFEKDAPRIWKAHYELRPVSLLGSGSFGEVWKVQHIVTKHLYAVKKVSIYRAYRELQELDKVLREVYLPEKIKHECVVEYQTFWFENSEREIQFKEIQVQEFGSSTSQNDNYFLYIQMQICDGDLNNLLSSRALQTISQNQLTKMFKQIASGLDAIHQKNIIHRDLKPANIFFKRTDIDIIWKIGDFGLALQTPTNFDAPSVRGTFCYQSPEMENRLVFTNKTDIYSLGLVFLETLLRIQNVNEVRSLLYTFRFQVSNENIYQDYLSKLPYTRFDELILKMLERNPLQRPTAAEICDDLF